LPDSTYHFDFAPLKNGSLNIPKAYATFLAEAAAHCLALKQHSNPVQLSLTGDLRTAAMLDWGGVIEGATYADLQEATEYGAYGIALVVALALTGITNVERSAKTTGVDYWLGGERSDDGIFQRAARLEISGILDGDDSKIATRMNIKLRQTNRSDESLLPAYVAIVEFRTPEPRFAKKVKVPR